MKRIIGGRQYDTAKAKAIGSRTAGGHSIRDFYYIYETLYRKRTGEFFLHGEGGALSQYRVVIAQNEYASGENIVPLSYETAREWAEKYLTVEEYEKTFGIVPEDDGATALYCQIDSSVLARARQEAARGEMTLGAWVERALSSALEYMLKADKNQ